MLIALIISQYNLLTIHILDSKLAPKLTLLNITLSEV